jgi:hypothetical protein
VYLLARSQSARKQVAQEAVDRFIDVTRPLLAELAAKGNHWARETLAFHDLESVPPEQAEAALARLTTHSYTNQAYSPRGPTPSAIRYSCGVCRAIG